MTKIEVGDRVRVKSLGENWWDIEIGIKVGDEGTVVIGGSLTVGVRMDKYNKNLHDCDGLCEGGHCWWFGKSKLELIENEVNPSAIIMSVESLSFIMGAVVTSNLPQSVKEDIGKIIDSIKTK